MKFKPLTESDVRFVIYVEPEDTPVRGNAMASGDPAVDKEVEDEVIRQLDNGNEWAWAFVSVQAQWTAPSGQTYTGFDQLGCCSYESEADFKQSDGYYKDMCVNALDDLNKHLSVAFEDLQSLCESP